MAFAELDFCSDGKEQYGTSGFSYMTICKCNEDSEQYDLGCDFAKKHEIKLGLILNL